MNGQYDPFFNNEPEDNGTKTQKPEGESAYYSYSSATPYVTVSEKKRNNGGAGRVFLTFFAVVICLAVAFGVGTVGGMVGYRYQQLRDGNSIQKAPTEDLHTDNPADVLSKSEENKSKFGSAGEDVFSVSQVAAMVADSVVVIETNKGSGSGVIISEDGYIITCNHVVENAREVVIKLNNEEQYEAALVGRDPTSDLAILKIDTDHLTYAKQGSSADLIVGERVVAVGNPLGTLGGTVTDGIISAKERLVKTDEGVVMKLMQTNAAINQGNSGGGLFNLDGQLIGIVNAKYAASGVEGLAFAIPIDSAYVVEQELIEYGYIRGVVDHGLSLLDINDSNYWSYFMRYSISQKGVYVLDSEICTELSNGDRIVSVDGQEVSTAAEVEAIIDCHKVGDSLVIVAERKGKQFSVTLVLAEYIPDNTLVDFNH